MGTIEWDPSRDLPITMWAPLNLASKHGGDLETTWSTYNRRCRVTPRIQFKGSENTLDLAMAIATHASRKGRKKSKKGKVNTYLGTIVNVSPLALCHMPHKQPHTSTCCTLITKWTACKLFVVESLNP